MDFTRSKGLYSAPFPSDDLVTASGAVDLSLWPNPRNNDLINRLLALLSSAKGFSLAGGVFFALDSPLDAAKLPDVNGSLASDANAFVFGIDPGSPDYLVRRPVYVSFEADGGPFGAPNLLSLLPVQGIPLRPSTSYAAVVRRGLLDAKGRRLAPAQIPNLPTYRKATTALAAAKIPLDDVAGLAAFTTADPTADLQTVRADALTKPKPLPTGAWTLKATYPAYCLYASTVQMPVYQRGAPPYTSSGGGWTFDNSGKPVFQRFETANLFATIPRSAMPANGWPTVVYIRAGGGGDAPLADRGVQDANGNATPGTGLAMHFAAVGWAGVQVDGPLGGLRNTTGGDEQFLVFNVGNPEALRDNVRQTAVELGALAQALDQLALDTSGCAGTGASAKIDVANLALFGHSTGAWIAPLALASEPRLRATILSGAGGSWVENVIEKQKPVPVKPFAELLLNYDFYQRSLTQHDPALTLFQWATEPADEQVYARRVLREPDAGSPARHTLMLQGIVDHYILPRIAHATSLGIGLDLGGPALDAQAAELAQTAHELDVLPLVGRGAISLPVNGNVNGTTAVVVQHLADGIEDGHEVNFQTDSPKHQLRCFLSTLLAGAPRVYPDAAADAPCQ